MFYKELTRASAKVPEIKAAIEAVPGVQDFITKIHVDKVIKPVVD